MFRIKNVRNSTVAKQSNLPNGNVAAIIKRPEPLPPALNSKNPQGPKVSDIQKSGVVKRVQLLKKNQNLKIKRPQSRQRVVLKANVPKKIGIVNHSNLIIKETNVNNDNKLLNMCKEIQTKEEKLISINKHIQISKIEQIKPKQQFHLQQKKQRQQLKECKQNEERHLLLQCQKKKLRQQQQRMQRERQEQRVNQLREERRVRRERQEQQQRASQAKLQQMMEKVNARRKAREKQRQQRLRFQNQLSRQNSSSVGGMITLSDSLAHVEMTEAVMDTQINLILNMKFADYPNKQAIERQVEELERINRSYLLVRVDPHNPLIRGLSNFRVELFNRVGEMIMQAQTQLGPTSSGLQVIQADSRNGPSIEGVSITRGLQGYIDKVLKEVILSAAEECPICLSEIGKGSEVYEIGCGHRFHEGCLRDWLSNNANCPACRFNIKYNHH